MFENVCFLSFNVDSSVSMVLFNSVMFLSILSEVCLSSLCFLKVIHFFHSDEQPELNLENDSPNKTGHNLKIKGELQRENKLISYERAFKMLENDMYIAGIGQAVLELLSFKVESGKSPKGNLLTSEIFGHFR